MPRFLQINDLTKPADMGQLKQWTQDVHQELTVLQSKKNVNDTTDLERRLKLLEARVLRLEHP